MAQAKPGASYERDAIAGVIVEASSFFKGKGSMIGRVLGVMTISAMNTLLNLYGFTPSNR